MYPTVELNLGSAVRGIAALEGLVRYVLATNLKNETDWLEWKVGVDLTSPGGRFAVAKQILGFANRDPSRPLAVGGCGYVVLGAEPNNLAGADAIDPADLNAGLRRYVGDDGPAWSPLWVELDGSEVLIILVEPPQAGDRIHTLEREFDGFQDGTVFIRRVGGTHQASSAEQRMLQDRLLARPILNELGLSLDVHSEAIRPLDLTPTTFDAWLATEQRDLLAPLEADRRRKRGSSTGMSFDTGEVHGQTARSIAEISSMISASALAGLNSQPESRGEDEYEHEVNQYLEGCEQRLPDAARRTYFQQRVAVLSLAIENTTLRNMPAVEVHVTMEGEVFSYASAPKGSLPARPRLWGPKKISLLGMGDYDLMAPRLSSIAGADYGRSDPPFTTDNHGSTTVRFRPVDVRPGYRVPLPDVRLVVLATESEEIVGTWYATTTGMDGLAEGIFSIPLGEPIDWPALCEAEATGEEVDDVGAEDQQGDDLR